MIDVADNNAVYYYHFDGLGSVIALSNANKQIIERYSYDVFGEPNRTSDVNNPYLFTGRRYDPEAGLYYYRARYYAYDIARFLQTDPIGYNTGLNMYACCGNNPINWSDPFGLVPINLITHKNYIINTGSEKAKPEKLLAQLGAYGNPFEMRGSSISAYGSPPLYVQTETSSIKGYGLIAGVLTKDYGIWNAVGTGSGWMGSVKLVTYRRPGAGTIAYHQLKIYWPVQDGIVGGDVGELWGWQPLEDVEQARRILLNNVDLMQRAIETTRPSWIGRFFEVLVEASARVNPR
jgi:RHS repeat-associated protein